MRRLLRSKKGTVIGDIFGGISSSISHFLSSAPKPILIIIFLVFLLFFATIFSFFLQITGNFCDTAGNEYRTGTFNLVTNIGLLSSIPSEDELNSEAIPVEGGFIESELWYDCSNEYNEDFLYKHSNGTWVQFTGERYYYIGTSKCVECLEEARVKPDIEDEGFFYTVTYSPIWNEKVCLDEKVYPKPYEELSFFGKISCNQEGEGNTCSVPQGYYFDGNTNKFLCYEELCMGNATNTLGKRWNLKLREKGATLQPPSPHGDRDYRNALRIECDKGDLHPKLRVFGVNPFDYRIWLFLIILSALVWVVFKIKRR